MKTQEAQAALIEKVKKEVTQYDLGQYWVTDKVAFNMREMIKQFRKNYWGLYDEPVDKITGKEKIWLPLTRLLVDSVRKMVDVDTKDIRFRSTSFKRTYVTHLLRGYVRRWLSKTYFNHSINQAIFTMAVDGTEVWKTYIDKNGKVVTKDVDLLNVYIDPTADSIQDAYRFTERLLMTKTEMKKMDWENTAEFSTQQDLEKNDGETGVKKTGEYGDVYECWGLFPKNEVYAAMDLEHDEEDDSEIEAHVVISGIDTGNVQFHFAEENKTKDNEGNIIKPYEEAWYIKVPGRWYGIGIPETVMPLQFWINQTINLRINKNTIAQLGLLKIRRGAKVTQQMLQQLVSKGVITLADPERDLQQLDIRESGQSSYEDERTAKAWAQEVTSVFDINLAELPASATATGAAIQDKQSRSAFTLIVESTEHFIQRWMDRHVLPNLPAQIKKEGYVTFYRDFDDIRNVREQVATALVRKNLQDNLKKGRVPSEQELVDKYNQIIKRLEKRGDLLFETTADIITEGIETEVFVTNSEIDIGVTVRNLIELRAGVDPQSAKEMTAEAMDLLGLRVPDSLKQPVQAAPEPEMVAAAPVVPEQPELDATGLTTEALTLNNEQR